MWTVLRRVLPNPVYLRLRRSHNKKHGLEPSLDDFLLAVEDRRVDPALRAMVKAFVAHDVDAYLSKFWLQMAQNHVQRLAQHGFEHFKQTLAVEYFTFAQEATAPGEESQLAGLQRTLPEPAVRAARAAAERLPAHPFFSPEQSRYYNLLTVLLWEYAKAHVPASVLEALQEPRLGNPPLIEYDGRLISQDIANSVLEYQAILDGFSGGRAPASLMEVGAGYGRVGYVFLTLNLGARYYIVDIPPTLYVSQRYLSEIFPSKRVFTFRDFTSYDDVRQEMEAAQLVFLMPHQLALLPPDTVELFIGINCLNEMNGPIRTYYFSQVDRIARHMYFKCHKVADTPYAGRVTEQDYPILPRWRKIYWRECKVQSYFFEAFFAIA